MRKILIKKAPLTAVGIFFGLLIGGLGAIIEVLKLKVPLIGLLIMVLMPAIAFIFEQAIGNNFKEYYREKIAGVIYSCWYWIFNERFSMKFIYSISFYRKHPLKAEEICNIIGAAPGQDPSPDAIAGNYIHIQFSNIQNHIRIEWHNIDAAPYKPADYDEKNLKYEIIIALHPVVQVLVTRDAYEQLASLEHKVTWIRNKLLAHFQNGEVFNVLEESADAIAWHGLNEPPEDPIYIKENEAICDATVRISEGRVTLSAKNVSVITCAYRWMKKVEPV